MYKAYIRRTDTDFIHYYKHSQWCRNEFAHVQCKAPEKFLSCPSTFFGSTSTISRFGERFRDGQYSLVSLLFAVLLTMPPWARAQLVVKVGEGWARALRALWSRRQ